MTAVRAADEVVADVTAPEPVPLYVWLFLAGLVASMFAGHTGDMGLPLPLDRALLGLAILLLLLDPDRERLRGRAFYVIGALTLVWTAFSWFSTGAVTDSAKAFALLDRIAIPLAMFPLGALAFRTAQRRELLLRTAALTGIYLGIIGVAEFLKLDSLVFPSYITNLAVATTETRSGGPWMSPEPFGMASALALFCAVLLWRVAQRALWRVVAVLGAAGGIAGSVLSMTRSVWGAVLVSALLIGLILPRVRRRLPLLVIGGVLVGVAILVVFPELREALLERLLTQRSVYDRQNTNAAALRIITQLPLFGIGWGEFIHQNVLWVRQADTYPVTTVTIEVHNVFLSRAAETGLVGAVLWILCFATGPLLGLLAKPRSTGAARWKLLGLAASFTWLFPSLLSPNPYPMPNYLIWLIWGIASRGILIDLPRPATPAELKRSAG